MNRDPLPGTPEQRDQWCDAHQRCPKCGGLDIQQTLAGQILLPGVLWADNHNRAYCMRRACKWVGKTEDLKP